MKVVSEKGLNISIHGDISQEDDLKLSLSLYTRLRELSSGSTVMSSSSSPLYKDFITQFSVLVSSRVKVQQLYYNYLAI